MMMMNEYQKWAMDVMKIRFNKKISICKINHDHSSNDNNNSIKTKDIDHSSDNVVKHDVDCSDNNNDIDVERGVYALENINANSSILEVPFSSLLSIHSISSYQTSSLSSSSSLQLHPLYNLQDILTREDDILSIILIYEIYIKKKDSKFYQHIQYIPTHYQYIIL